MPVHVRRPAISLLHPPGSNWVGVTDLKKRPLSGQPGGDGAAGAGAPNGPLRTNQRAFVLVANTPLQLAPGNPWRESLIIQNRDPAVEIFVSFGQPADNTLLSLAPGAPGGSVVLDVKCPTDAVWAFATANASGYFAEMAKTW